jgi:hypothetical protein
MNIVHATRHYESWLARKVSIVREDLGVKDKSMAADSFSFLRATFFRMVAKDSEKRLYLSKIRQLRWH